MTDTIQAVALRLLQTREALGKTTQEVAAIVDVDHDQYLRYENGDEDLPIGFLTRFADAFEIPLTSLLSGEEPKLSTFAVNRGGKGIHVQRSEGYEYQALAHRFAHKKVEPFNVTVQPDDSPVKLNAHLGQEFDLVLSGTLKYTIGHREIILETGDSIYFDSAYMHGMQAQNGEPATFLAVVIGND